MSVQSNPRNTSTFYLSVNSSDEGRAVTNTAGLPFFLHFGHRYMILAIIRII
jgi:hypothetical protein